jgi:hypothetical protein
MNGIRVVIAKLLQKQSITRATRRTHGHFQNGTRTKLLILTSIMQIMQSFKSCYNTQNNVSKIQSHQWDFLNKPWERAQIDYAGPFMEYSFPIVVDAHSKWPEIIPTKPNDFPRNHQDFTRDMFTLWFAIDSNKRQRFKLSLMQIWGFLQDEWNSPQVLSTVSPSWKRPSKTFRSNYETKLKSNGKWTPNSVDFYRFLMQYRITPHTTTKRSPAEPIEHHAIEYSTRDEPEQFWNTQEDIQLCERATSSNTFL